jgi:hypothetical protein
MFAIGRAVKLAKGVEDKRLKEAKVKSLKQYPLSHDGV